MASLITLHESNGERDIKSFFTEIPDILLNVDNNMGYLIDSKIQYSIENSTFLYYPKSTLIVTSNHPNGNFYYYQQLLPVENQPATIPKIYLKGSSNGKSIMINAKKWNDSTLIPCYTTILPKSKHDYICVDGNCYKCSDIELSDKGIIINIEAFNLPYEVWKDRFIRYYS